MTTTDGQELIRAFFAALELRQLELCTTALAELQALARDEPSFEPWWAYLSGVLTNERDHDWAAAERTFLRLLQAELEPPLRGRVLLALGRTYQYQGRWAESIDSYEQSLPIFASLGSSIDQAKVWKQLAIVCDKRFSQGDAGPEALEQAQAYCRRALEVLAPIPDPSPALLWLTGSIWNTLGLVSRGLGQWDTAIACFQQDMAICQSLDDRHGIGVLYLNLGEVYQSRGSGSWTDALSAYQAALALLREFDDRHLEAETLANLGYLYRELGEFERALATYSQALQVVEDLRASASSETARAGFFSTIVETYANAVLLCLTAGRHQLAFDYVERARSRAFLDLLAAGSPELAHRFSTRPITLAEVQAALPDGALLLEYFTTGVIEVPEGESVPPGVHRHRFPPARTLVFAVTRDGLQVYDASLSPNDLRPGHLKNVVARHFLEPAIRRALYDYLIAPVQHLLADAWRVFIVPHGPLHYIPFHALVASDGASLLRGGGPQVVYGPSATVLFGAPRRLEGRARGPGLAVGFNGTEPEKLQFAEEEAGNVAQIIGAATLIGPEAKKATLFDRAPWHRIIHLSCHGTFNPKAPLESALYLAPGETLTALDVLAHLRLTCDLVTLSACESGLSRIRRGDELEGYVRAFLYAGASAIICTLWRVDERSTLLLMERFYQEVQAGAGFAEALKRAQLALAELPDTSGEGRPFADPYYWAPFILVGSGSLDLVVP